MTTQFSFWFFETFIFFSFARNRDQIADKDQIFDKYFFLLLFNLGWMFDLIK